MDLEIREWPFRLTVILGAICLMLLVACKQSSPSIAPTSQPSPTSAALPKFLSLIYPKSGELIAQERLSVHHISGILRLEEIAESGETLETDELQGRIELLVDGEFVDTEVSQGLRSGTIDVRPVRRSALSLGEHKVIIRVRRTSGEVLKYSWPFTVLAEEPTLPGLPEGLQFVRPLPDSTTTVQAYQEEYLVPPYYAPGFADLRGGVCAGVLSGKVVERGEFLDGSVGEKYSFTSLDDTPPGSEAVIEGGYEPLKVSVFDDSGHTVASYVGPHHYWCWRIDLTPGKHEATVRLRNASGAEIDYTWAFTITNN
jgi:hypothetical protein